MVIGSVVWIDFSPWYSFLGYIGLPLGVGLILKGRTKFIMEILYKKYSWLLF